jgi:hypothetical protein
MEKLVNNVVWPITCETTFYFFNKDIADNITTEGKKNIHKLLNELDE